MDNMVLQDMDMALEPLDMGMQVDNKVLDNKVPLDMDTLMDNKVLRNKVQLGTLMGNKDLR